MKTEKKTYQWHQFKNQYSKWPEIKELRQVEYYELIRETWDHRRSESNTLKNTKRI
jgi:hypothetical protein